MVPTPLRFGPFELDPRTGKVLRQGEPLALGHRATRLLECLLSRPGEILTKSELMDAAWPDVVVEEGNLTVQMAALRRALALPGGGDWIVTIPRIGYRFVGEAPAPSTPDATKYEEPPSIAVEPFDSLSHDPEATFLADGLSGEIAVALGEVAGLLVISHGSRAPRGTATLDPGPEPRERRAGFRLKGSVRQSHGRFRVIAQLLDGATDSQHWAERFEGEASDSFALQDEVARSVTNAVRERVTASVAATATGNASVDVELVDLVLRARSLLRGPTQNAEVLTRAVELLRNAIEREPTYAEAYTTLADAYVRDFQNRWSDAPNQSLMEARRLADKAIELEPNDAGAHVWAALVSNFLKDFPRTDSELEQAEALNPDHPSVLGLRGSLLLYGGKPLDAIPYFERAMRLEPAATIHGLHMLGLAYLYAERYETAAALFRERILQAPGTDMSRGYLTSALGYLGRLEEARQVWAELMAINPRFSLEDWLARQPIRDPAIAQRILAGARKARVVLESQE
jgi:DNA-binding winged helix-turn-helix (wHTH) protein